MCASLSVCVHACVSISVCMSVCLCVCLCTVFCPHWSALVGNNHLSDELTTSQIMATETVLSIYWINSTKCKLESNHHSKYPGQNTVCMYMCVCWCTCVSICVHVCLSVYTCVCLCTYVCLSVVLVIHLTHFFIHFIEQRTRVYLVKQKIQKTNGN